jgi:hypothetical protein
MSYSEIGQTVSYWFQCCHSGCLSSCCHVLVQTAAAHRLIWVRFRNGRSSPTVMPCNTDNRLQGLPLLHAKMGFRVTRSTSFRVKLDESCGGHGLADGHDDARGVSIHLLPANHLAGHQRLRQHATDKAPSKGADQFSCKPQTGISTISKQGALGRMDVDRGELQTAVQGCTIPSECPHATGEAPSQLR